MRIETADDVVRAIASVLRADRGEVVPHLRIEWTRVYDLADNRDAVGMAVQNSESMKWVERGPGDSYTLTEAGLRRYRELEEESRWGRLERFFRRESKVRGLTWGVLLQVLTLLIALIGLSLSIGVLLDR
jgi:Mn-dependent DtxR family transcriptional regulator